MLEKKLFVWDFHGVLERGNELAVIEITNLILERHAYKVRLSQVVGLKLYGLKWYQYFEFLLPGEDKEKLMLLQDACFRFVQEYPEIIARYISQNDYANEVIKKIGSCHDQIVISNTTKVALKMFLKLIELDKYFWPNKAFATDSHRNPLNKKHLVLMDFLKGKNYKDYIFVGDSAEDVQLVEVSGGKSYLYAHPGRVHKNAKADYKINDLREILKEI